MKLLSVITPLLAIALMSCQNLRHAESSIDTPRAANLDEFASLMEAVFETSPDDTQTIIRDRRQRVKSKYLEGIWVYTQLNTGVDKKIYRQRLSHLSLSEDKTKIIQTAYGFKKPDRYADAWTKISVLNSIKPSDFEPYFDEGCEQIWTPNPDGSWSGYVNPKTCIITSKRRGKQIRIESEGYLSGEVYRTNERGYDMDMTFLWGTKPNEMITLYPIR